MTNYAKNTRATIIPILRYKDAGAAIDWLYRALGFEKHLVVPGENGLVLHAQLTFGNGMIMLGSARDGDFGKLQASPADAMVSQSPYIVIDDVDGHDSGPEFSFKHGIICNCDHAGPINQGFYFCSHV